MNRRKSIGIVASVLLLIAVLCSSFWPASDSDEVKYRRCVRNRRRAEAQRHWVEKLPNFLVSPVSKMIMKRPSEAFRAQERALLASGFLTNAVIVWTNVPATFSNNAWTGPKLNDVKHLFGTVAKEDAFTISRHNNDFLTRRSTVEFICPAKYFPLFVKAVENRYGDTLKPNPQGRANGSQPFNSETNRTPAAAASRRSP